MARSRYNPRVRRVDPPVYITEDDVDDSVVARVINSASTIREYIGNYVVFVISPGAATSLVQHYYGDRRRAPRLGHFIDLPESKFQGHRGHWTVTHQYGRFELQFYYRA